MKFRVSVIVNRSLLTQKAESSPGVLVDMGDLDTVTQKTSWFLGS